MTLGGSPDYYKQHAHDAVPATALKDWAAGARLVNTNLFVARGEGAQRKLVYRANGRPLDGALVKLNTDPHFSDDWRRYLIAEI